MVPEVRSRLGWRPLRRTVPVPVGESDLFELRGLPPNALVAIGSTSTNADNSGAARIPLREHEDLRGHLGLIEVRVDGRLVGEIDVRPDKLSEDAWRKLRSDLELVWSGLVLDPEGVSRLEASLPPPNVLWSRIEGAVHDILDSPREVLTEGQVARRSDRVRRARELTPSVQRAGMRGGAGLARVTIRSTATPENAMVADTLQRLRAYARRHPDGQHVATQVGVLLRNPVLAAPRSRRHRGTTWGMRSDQRYRRVHALDRLLRRPDLEPTEGPGELRLGVEGMIRLYEYWVYLQVLLACVVRYGPPEGEGFAALAVPLRDGRRRLELAAGTTVTFPGPVHVAFEPRITTRGDGWMGLEYVPHPDPDRYQAVATPDVVVLREGPAPWATVIDAKYVGRTWVEKSAVRMHEKYARMRLDGTPVVHHVLVAHPHRGLDDLWAGYGAVSMVPGRPLARLPLPTPPLPPPRSEPALGRPAAGDLSVEVAPGDVVVLADQFWMHEVLMDRRIDIDALVAVAAQGRSVHRSVMVMPVLPALISFQRMLEHHNWLIVNTDSIARSAHLLALESEAGRVAPNAQVVLVSGDPDAIQRCALAVESVGGVLEVFDDLETLPDLHR